MTLSRVSFLSLDIIWESQIFVYSKNILIFPETHVTQDQI